MSVRDRIVELRRVPARNLIPNPRNWRTHPEGQQTALRELLNDVGYADALLARETTDGLVLIDGHLRAETTPDAEVPVLVLDVTEEEADKILLTLDPLASLAGVDADALESLLDDVHLETGELVDLLRGQTGREKTRLGFTDPDAIPEPPAEPITQQGDLWLLGEHRVLCGDATERDDVERVLAGERPAMVWADPPYGIDYQAMRRDDKIANDTAAEMAQQVTAGSLQLVHDATAFFVCCSWRSLGSVLEAMGLAAIEAKACIVWDKGRGVQNLDRFAKQHEFVVYAGPYGGQPTVATDVWTIERDFDPDHPTPKPVVLVEKAIAAATVDRDLIFDPFLGSGPSVIAAERTDRRAVGLELEPRYVDVICRRYQEHTGDIPRRENGEPVSFTDAAAA